MWDAKEKRLSSFRERRKLKQRQMRGKMAVYNDFFHDCFIPFLCLCHEQCFESKIQSREKLFHFKWKKGKWWTGGKSENTMGGWQWGKLFSIQRFFSFFFSTTMKKGIFPLLNDNVVFYKFFLLRFFVVVKRGKIGKKVIKKIKAQNSQL